MDAFTLVGKLVLDSAGFMTSLDGIATGSGATGLIAKGSTIGNLISNGIQSALRAGTDFVKSSIETSMDFDEIMSNIRSKRTEMTDAEFESLRKTALELGRTTKYTAAEVANAMYYEAIAGWDVQKMLDGVRGTLDLAAASGDSLSETSDIVTDALTAFGLTARDSGHFVDVLAAAAANSNTNVQMMGQAFKYLAPLAGSLQYSVDDVAIALGLMANSGVKASMAGTSMRQTLSTLVDPSKEAAKAMKELGISLDDETGKIKPFRQLMGELRQVYQENEFDPQKGRTIEEIAAAEEKYAQTVEALNAALDAGSIKSKDYSKQMTAAQEELADYIGFNVKFLGQLGDIAGLRGISGLLAIMKSTDEEFNQIVDSVNNSQGAAEKMSTTMMDNLKGDVTLLQSAVDGLKIVASDKFNENLRAGTQAITDWVTRIADVIENGFGDAVDRAADKESKAITDAEKNANQAHGIVGYMETLVAEFGDAATKTEAWQEALSKLNPLLEGAASGIVKEAESAKQATDNLKAYIDLKRQQAIENAKQKTIGEYKTAYEDALSAAQSAQIAMGIAQSDKAYVQNEVMRIFKQYYQDAWTENQEAAWRGMMEKGQFNQLYSTLRYAADEIGVPTETIDALIDSYTAAEASERENSAKIDALNAAADKAKAALEIAEAQFAAMNTQTAQSGLDALGSAASSLAGRLSGVSVPRAAGYGALPKAIGDYNVPYDNYLASLHRGEMVLNATKARQYRSGEGNGSAFDADTLMQVVSSAVIEGMKNAHIDAYLDGRSVTEEVSRRLNSEMALRR